MCLEIPTLATISEVCFWWRCLCGQEIDIRVRVAAFTLDPEVGCTRDQVEEHIVVPVAASTPGQGVGFILARAAVFILARVAASIPARVVVSIPARAVVSIPARVVVSTQGQAVGYMTAAKLLIIEATSRQL
jgi:hypothetical protein